MNSSLKWNHWVALGVLGLGVFFAYAGSFRSAFQFDDLYYIVNNTALRDIRDISAIWNAINTPVRFLTFYTFALNYHLHQLDVFGFHVVNFGIHLLNTFLLYGFVCLLFQTPRLKRTSLAPSAQSVAFLAAFLFGVHPLGTQAVTYISQRFASLATCFYLLAVCAYLKARLAEKRKAVYFLLCGLAMLGGMLSKQITITIPLMFFVFEFLCFKGSRKSRYRAAVCFLPLILFIPLFYNLKAGFMGSAVAAGNSVGEYVHWQTYALTQTRVIAHYVRLFFVPLGQRLDYLFPLSYSLLEWRVLGSLTLLGTLLCSAFYARRRYPLFAVGVFWFFVTLLVESSFLLIKHVIFEHRAYLPSIGLCIVVSAVLHHVIRFKRHLVGVMVCLLLTLSFLTFERNKVWQSAFTLWEDNLKKEPTKARSHISLGIAHIQNKNFDEALRFLNQAVELDATQMKAFHNRALAYQEKGKYDLALADYTKALTLDGQKGVVYSNRGNLHRIMGNAQASLEDFNRSIELLPGYAQSYINRGVHFGEINNHALALNDFTRAIELNPLLSEAFNNRGVVYQQMGSLEKSEADFNEALRVHAHYAEAFYNRANTYKELRRFDEALADYQRAIAIEPKYAQAHNNQGIVLGALDRFEEALLSFNRAVEMDPNLAGAYFNRSLVFIRLNQFDAALKDALRSEQLGKTVKPEYIRQLQDLSQSTVRDR